MTKYLKNLLAELVDDYGLVYIEVKTKDGVVYITGGTGK